MNKKIDIPAWLIPILIGVLSWGAIELTKVGTLEKDNETQWEVLRSLNDIHLKGE